MYHQSRRENRPLIHTHRRLTISNEILGLIRRDTMILTFILGRATFTIEDFTCDGWCGRFATDTILDKAVTVGCALTIWF